MDIAEPSGLTGASKAEALAATRTGVIAPPAENVGSLQAWPVGLALLCLGSLSTAIVGSGAGWRTVLLLWTGAGLGLALYHAAYGFAAGYRVFLGSGYSAHVRAQIVMLAVAVALFYPALSAGSVLGQPVRGFIFPIGLELAAGAFIFGIGMQIAGGCGSGTLYTVGGGSVRMVVTLLFFIVGATGAAWSWEGWSGLPRLPAVSLAGSIGFAGAVAVQLAVLAALWWLVARRERMLTGGVASIWRRGQLRTRPATLLLGPWPYGWAALALAGLAFLTLVLAGRPWGITQAFALWGSWAVERGGFDDPHFWPYWEEPTRVDLLPRAALADVTTLMNIGVALGALAAAGLAGAFRPRWRLTAGELSSSVIGGLLLGFGAIMATGCNISALFGGVASGSLHGWVWLVAALAGSFVGIRLRPVFGLDDRRASL